MTIDNSTIKKIAIIRIGKIGDMIVSNFALKKIRQTFPDANILLITLPRVKELLQYSEDVNKIHYFQKGFDLFNVLMLLRKFKADLLIDFNDGPSGTSKLIAQFSRSKIKVGFGFQNNSKYLTIPVKRPDNESSHITERIRLIAEAIGMSFQPNEIKPSLTIGPREFNSVKNQLNRANPKRKPIIAVNLSAGDKSRYWTVDKWWKLLMEIKKVEKDIIFLLLSAPTDVHIAKDVGTPFPSDTIIFPAYSDFQHFASYIAQADLLISPDTSAVHIACAFSIPLIALYPKISWNYASWKPVNTVFQSVMPETGNVSEIQWEKVYQAYCQIRPDIHAFVSK